MLVRIKIKCLGKMETFFILFTTIPSWFYLHVFDKMKKYFWVFNLLEKMSDGHKLNLWEYNKENIFFENNIYKISI